MLHLPPAPLATSNAQPGPSTPAAAQSHPAPVLITEQQVAFSTAAAASVAANRRRWLDTAVLTGLVHILAELRDPRPHCPHREPSYMESARMSRAMDRL